MSWQRTHAATVARRTSSKRQSQVVPGEEMVTASYYTGVGYNDVKLIINMTGRKTQSRATFSRKQAKSEEKMIQCANQLTKDARSRFSGQAAINGRWSSPKPGLHGTVSTVDSITHEVRAFSTENKKGKNRTNGKYSGSSNNKETVGNCQCSPNFSR